MKGKEGARRSLQAGRALPKGRKIIPWRRRDTVALFLASAAIMFLAAALEAAGL